MLIEEGKEYSLVDREAWASLAISRGDVLEIYLPGTDLGCAEEIWAGFWLKQVIIGGGGE